MTESYTIKHLAEETSPLGQENQQMQILSLAGFFFVKLASYKIQKEVSFNRIANLNTKDIR
jgi:hypothetical protein